MAESTQKRVGASRSFLNQGPRRPAQDELKNDYERKMVNQLTDANIKSTVNEGISTLNALKNAYDENRLSETSRKLYESMMKEKQAFEARQDRYRSKGDNFVKRAQDKTMGESPLERLAHLARFNEQSLAFMMFCKLLHFGFDLSVCVAGAKLMLGHEMRLFKEQYDEDKNKLERDKVTFDWDDYTPKTDNPAEKNSLQEKLKQRKIYHFRFKQNGKFELYGEPITDINEISYDILLANRLFPKPSRISQIRKSCIEYCVEMSGAAGDRAYWIQKQIEEEFDKDEPKSKAKLDDAESTALLNAARPAPTGR